jgi:hypothetical protein
MRQEEVCSPLLDHLLPQVSTGLLIVCCAGFRKEMLLNMQIIVTISFVQMCSIYSKPKLATIELLYKYGTYAGGFSS